jgi:hypothetical protein
MCSRKQTFVKLREEKREYTHKICPAPVPQRSCERFDTLLTMPSKRKKKMKKKGLRKAAKADRKDGVDKEVTVVAVDSQMQRLNLKIKIDEAAQDEVNAF